MSNEFAKNCSHCGHNSRAASCSKGCTGIKLFGVQINVADDGAAAESSLRKTKSFDNLQACIGDNTAVEAAGYLSDGLVHQKSRKKGKPWSEEEHRSFLLGLEKLGKGDWKGIANDYVLSRNSSQVASHAQKYFIRKGGIEKKRRRASVFDIPLTDQLDRQSEVTNPVSQSAESSQTRSISSAKINKNELKGQASMPASERPPPVPIRRRGCIPDFRSTDHSPRLVPRFTRGFPPRPPPPPLAWLPIVNFSGEIRGFLPNIRGDLATYPTFLRPTLCQQQGSSPAAAPTTKNDELNLSISNLTLNH